MPGTGARTSARRTSRVDSTSSPATSPTVSCSRRLTSAADRVPGAARARSTAAACDWASAASASAPSGGPRTTAVGASAPAPAVLHDSARLVPVAGEGHGDGDERPEHRCVADHPQGAVARVAVVEPAQHLGRCRGGRDRAAGVLDAARPDRQQPVVEVAQAHVGSRTRSRARCRSGAYGLSKLTQRPSAGWANDRRTACSHCRSSPSRFDSVGSAP